MASGGARSGAGRKPGAASRMNEQARAKVAAEGITPLDYMLSIMRDEKQDVSDRMDAAKAAAPYVHAKLASVDVNATVDGKMSVTFKTVYENSGD